MIDFPIPTVVGQKFNSVTGATYVWDGVAWNLDTAQTKTAERRNRCSNPAIQIGQENGLTQVAGANVYGADQFLTSYSGAMSLGSQLVSLVTPNGSPNRLRVSVGVVD